MAAFLYHGSSLMLPDDPLSLAAPQQPPEVLGPAVPVASQSQSPEDPAFSLLDVFAITLFAIIAQIMFVTVAYGILRSMPRFRGMKIENIFGNGVVIMPIQTAWSILVIAFAALLVRSKYRIRFFEAIRWNWPDRHTCSKAILGGFGLAFLILAISAFLTPWRPSSLPVEKYFQSQLSAYLLALYGTFVAPFAEEIFFRGLLYPVLARDLDRLLGHPSQPSPSRTSLAVGAGIILTTIAFTLLHAQQLGYSWAALTPIFVVGLVLTKVRAAAQSVGLTVLIHASYNGTLFFLSAVGTHGFTK